jgi:hypothetical protein
VGFCWVLLTNYLHSSMSLLRRAAIGAVGHLVKPIPLCGG